MLPADEKTLSPENSSADRVKKLSAGDIAAAKLMKPLFDPVVITIPAKTQPKTTQSNDVKKPADTEKELATVKPAIAAEIAPCTIIASQDELSILNNGGSLGVLIGFERKGDLKTIKATSGSPNDVSVSLEPEIAGVEGRAFYVIKSTSAAVGAYQVIFEAPCGRKELAVTVR